MKTKKLARGAVSEGRAAAYWATCAAVGWSESRIYDTEIDMTIRR